METCMTIEAIEHLLPNTKHVFTKQDISRAALPSLTRAPPIYPSLQPIVDSEVADLNYIRDHVL